jgi:hypothetical protein
MRHRIVDQTIKEYIDLKLTEKLSTENSKSSKIEQKLVDNYTGG